MQVWGLHDSSSSRWLQWSPSPLIHPFLQSPPTMHQNWSGWPMRWERSDSVSLLKFLNQILKLWKILQLLSWWLFFLFQIISSGESQLPYQEESYGEAHMLKTEVPRKELGKNEGLLLTVMYMYQPGDGSSNPGQLSNHWSPSKHLHLH